jgi:small multidrug resistance pump
MLLFAIACVAIFEALGQSSMAMARRSIDKKIMYAMLGMICYCFVAYGLYVSYQWKGVGMVNAMWSSLSIIVMITIGHVFFKERLDAYEWIGVLLMIVGIVITQMAPPH